MTVYKIIIEAKIVSEKEITKDQILDNVVLQINGDFLPEHRIVGLQVKLTKEESHQFCGKYEGERLPECHYDACRQEES